MFDHDRFEDQLAALPQADYEHTLTAQSDHEVVFIRRLLLAYTLLAVYGSLFPWPSLRWPSAPLASLLTGTLFSPLSLTDVVFNLIIYVPFGLLMMRALGSMKFDASQLATVALAGMALSLTLESVQAFVPTRSPSLVDVFTNTLGALGGAALATLSLFSGEWGKRVQEWRKRYLISGPIATLGLLAVAMWMVAQLSPFVPSPSLSTLRHGLSPIWQWLTESAPFSTLGWIQHSAALFAVAVAIKQVLKPTHKGWPIYLLLGAILLLKVPVMGRQLSPEALFGWITGCTLAATLASGRKALTLAAGAALIYAAAERLGSSANGQLHPMEWVPFKGQMTGISGIADVAATAWPYMLVLFLLLWQRNQQAHHSDSLHRAPWSIGKLLTVGTLSIGAYALLLELLQTAVPGRYPDITGPLVAAAAWALPLRHPALKAAASPEDYSEHDPIDHSDPMHRAATGRS